MVRVSGRDGDNKTLMRSLGEFVGHIWSAVRADPGAGVERREVSRRTETETRETGAGTVTLRRTTVEEIEIRRESDDRRAGA